MTPPSDMPSTCSSSPTDADWHLRRLSRALLERQLLTDMPPDPVVALVGRRGGMSVLTAMSLLERMGRP